MRVLIRMRMLLMRNAESLRVGHPNCQVLQVVQQRDNSYGYSYVCVCYGYAYVCVCYVGTHTYTNYQVLQAVQQRDNAGEGK